MTPEAGRDKVSASVGNIQYKSIAVHKHKTKPGSQLKSRARQQCAAEVTGTAAETAENSEKH